MAPWRDSRWEKHKGVFRFKHTNIWLVVASYEQMVFLFSETDLYKKFKIQNYGNYASVSLDMLKELKLSRC